MTLVKIVPMAFVMIAGPQIISAVIFATSERARANSVAYVSGALASTIVGTTAFFFLWEALGFKSATQSGGHVAVDWTLAGLLAILALRVFLRRAEAEPPKWMGKLETASPGFALKLGLLLFIAMPTDILTMLAVSGYLSTHNESLANGHPVRPAGGPADRLPAACAPGDGPPSGDDPAEGAQLDERELVGRERDRHRVLPGPGTQGRHLELEAPATSRAPPGGADVGVLVEEISHRPIGSVIP